MTKFNIEDKVSLKNNPNIKVIISGILGEIDGEFAYEVQYPDGNVESLYESDLTEFVIKKDAWDYFAEDNLDDYRDFGIANTIAKINNVSNNTISTFKASRIKFFGYQYRPLIKFLKSINRRLLIADEVGLGKTIEAGNIMLELSARKELNNVLIVCSKSLTEKWQEEMLNKFYFNFKIYEKRKDFEDKLKEFGNFDESIKAIINYEQLRTDNFKFILREDKIEELEGINENLNVLYTIQDKVFLEQKDFEKEILKHIDKDTFNKEHDKTTIGSEIIKKAKTRDDKIEKNKILKLIEENEKNFDLVICDEAHRLRNKNTLNHKGLKKVLNNSNSAIFLTATPIMISLENLFNLLNLLDEREFDEYDKFEIALSNNKPFVKAITMLQQEEVILPKIAEFIENEEVKKEDFFYNEKVPEYFKDNYYYEEAIKLLKNETDTVGNRAKIIDFLTELSSINNIYTRTRKRDVETNRVKRIPMSVSVEFSNEEWSLYNSVIKEYDYKKSILGLIMKKRQITSCIPAFFENETDLIKGIYPKETDNKYSQLENKIINKHVLQEGKKIIIFSFFRKTLLYLKARIENELNTETEIIYGGMNDRKKRIDNFRENKNIKILLSSEVGSEGIDLQFCDTIVNYDLPWNPMVVEQRIGRIDRVGQEESKINIYTMVIKGTIEEQIFNRLLDRIKIFQEALGDLEEILVDDQNIISFDKLEQELYGNKKLTEEERNKKIDSVAFALENRRLDLEKIKEEQKHSISIDYAFENAIKDIEINNKYPTETEIKNYIRSIFRAELPACRLVKDVTIKDKYYIVLPNNNKNIINNFIENNKSFTPSSDVGLLYKEFKRKNIDNTRIPITFNQEYAFKNPKIEFINPLHPIINGTTEFFIKQKKDKNQAFRIALHKDSIDNEFSLPVGSYILVVYGIMIKKREPFTNKITETTFFKPVLTEFSGDKPKIIENNTCEYIFGLAQTKAKEPTIDYNFNEQFVSEFKTIANREILKQRRKIEKKENAKYISKIEMIRKREEIYYNSIIKRKQNLLDESEDANIIRMRSKEIENIKFDKAKRLNDLQKLKKNKMQFNNKLISVNYLQIID